LEAPSVPDRAISTASISSRHECQKGKEDWCYYSYRTYPVWADLFTFARPQLHGTYLGTYLPPTYLFDIVYQNWWCCNHKPISNSGGGLPSRGVDMMSAGSRRSRQTTGSKQDSTHRIQQSCPIALYPKAFMQTASRNLQTKLSRMSAFRWQAAEERRRPRRVADRWDWPTTCRSSLPCAQGPQRVWAQLAAASFQRGWPTLALKSHHFRRSYCVKSWSA